MLARRNNGCRSQRRGFGRSIDRSGRDMLNRGYGCYGNRSGRIGLGISGWRVGVGRITVGRISIIPAVSIIRVTESDPKTEVRIAIATTTVIAVPVITTVTH